MTDSYDELPTQLLCTAPGELPEEVHYVVDGILYDRTLSTAAHNLVVELIEKALHITVSRTDSAGIDWNTARTQPVHNAHVDGKFYCTDGDHYDLADPHPPGCRSHRHRTRHRIAEVISIHTALALIGSAGAPPTFDDHADSSVADAVRWVRDHLTPAATGTFGEHWAGQITLLRYVGAPTDFDTAVAYHIPALGEQGKKNCTNCAESSAINSE
ncbi:hypothetical protein [Antrihabitans spumae]|uniref:Uncharacterized protein n=1 Tax=Antrihabitans spumae TaxID=3373370 RepID=A0ABW7JZM8_9NOCA